MGNNRIPTRLTELANISISAADRVRRRRASFTTISEPTTEIIKSPPPYAQHVPVDRYIRRNGKIALLISPTYLGWSTTLLKHIESLASNRKAGEEDYALSKRIIEVVLFDREIVVAVLADDTANAVALAREKVRARYPQLKGYMLDAHRLEVIWVDVGDLFQVRMGEGREELLLKREMSFWTV